MCSCKSDNIRHEHCGHYVTIRIYDKQDCGSESCTYSAAHPPWCSPLSCECDRKLQPDRDQRVVGRSPSLCDNCRARVKAAPNPRSCQSGNKD
ncbi:hypothetical protein BKA62DRAFT_487187 [Auriculariales sp. MPI-PUGE-AT-0066]|nr:hypothetical protein BKA62DRAFT_487187 [Auriculariales sp. MPI-PUGE-AT-0066]